MNLYALMWICTAVVLKLTTLVFIYLLFINNISIYLFMIYYSVHAAAA
jgi:hypothetical protein